jgi:hypothetical protein
MRVARAMPRTPSTAEPPAKVRSGDVSQVEPLIRLERTPGKIEVELEDVDSLFDREAPPTYPHTGRMLNRAVAKFIVDTVREDRRSREVGVIIRFRGSPLRPEDEAGVREQLRHYFANEAEMAGLDQRVNSTEGLSSLRYAIPVVIVAGLVAGLLLNPSAFGAPAYLTEIGYLIAIVVTWVMLWDPIEKLLFDSYFIRLRIRALHKLAAAEILFQFQPGAPAPV